ncbi:hypothetical protein [Kineosporia succinea]|uniref:Uncharacterized protein n=1 Tax=Kineosporia succinea TaxID=84632 RepID=A0ABT9P1Q6_9ACTN|nr:hypothetical protein [Kineosporia succinea]MDP9826615.1 hypothetical protein [Kineosporia succinea]
MNAELRRVALVLGAGLVVVAVAGLIFWRSGGLDRLIGGDDSMTVQEAADRYLEQAPAGDGPLASEQGVIYAYSPEDYSNYEATSTLSVLALEAGKSSTHVRFSLSAQEEHQITTSRYTGSGGQGFRTATVTANGQTINGAEWTGPEGGTKDCTCGRAPESVGPAGVEISLLLPALPEAVTEIQLSVPGFVPLTVAVPGR